MATALCFVAGTKLAEPVIVYNFEVEDFHTYFVGTTGLLVHNTCYSALRAIAKTDARRTISYSDAMIYCELADYYNVKHHPPMKHPDRAGYWSDKYHIVVAEFILELKKFKGERFLKNPIGIIIQDINNQIPLGISDVCYNGVSKYYSFTADIQYWKLSYVYSKNNSLIKKDKSGMMDFISSLSDYKEYLDICHQQMIETRSLFLFST